jgi:uncharacterized repeat protein (TIGR01451 family)
VVDSRPIPDDSSGSPFPLDGGGYNVGTIPADGETLITFEIRVSITEPRVFVNRAEILAPPVADPDEHEIRLPCYVTGYSATKDLVDPSNGLIQPGQVITFDLSVVNTGEATIEQLTLLDKFNEECMSFNAASLAPSSAEPGEISWIDLSIAPGASITHTISFTVADPLPSGVPRTSNVILGMGVQDSLGRTQAITCGVSTINFQEIPPPELGCNCNCDLGVNVTIRNLSDFAMDEVITMIVDGQPVGGSPVHLEAHQTIVESRSWAELGLSKPPVDRDRQIVVRTDGSEGTCHCRCESDDNDDDDDDDGNGNGPPPCGPEAWLGADCYYGMMKVSNPCEYPFDETITVSIDGEIIKDRDGNQVDSLPVHLPPGQSFERRFEWGKDGKSLIDTKVHTITLQTRYETETVLVGPCWPDELPPTGHVCTTRFLNWPWMALPLGYPNVVDH